MAQPAEPGLTTPSDRPAAGRLHAVREARGWWACDAALAPALEALDLLSPGGFEAVCAGETAATGRGRAVRTTLPGAPDPVVVRPVLHGGLLGGLLRGALVGSRRAWRELVVTAALRNAGAPVPRPAFAAARRVAGPVWNALVATFWEPDAPDALAWLGAGPSPERIGRVARAAGRAVRRFHDAGGRHADLHVKNVLVRERDDAVEVVMVDLDGARCGDPPEARRRMRELARLYRSLLKRGVAGQVGGEARAGFLEGYVAGDATLAAGLARSWPRERRRVARHALHYPAR